MKKLHAAILGFGGIARCHASNYLRSKNVELVAVCDIDPKQLEAASASLNIGSTDKIDTSALRKYPCYEKLVAGERGRIDFIDICLPAYLHAKYVKRAMRDGFNVLSEKPMALSVRDCESIMQVKEETGRKYMVAQCLRFSADYAVLEKLVKSGKYGKLLRLDMVRSSRFPSWSADNWYCDSKKSGGAVLDLHLHDLDWVQSKLGLPKTLSCQGVIGRSGGWDDVDTTFRYGKDGPIVSMRGSWMSERAFTASFCALFEKAVLRYEGWKLSLADRDGKPLPLEVKGNDMYGAEIDYFASCIRKDVEPENCLPESTALSVALVEAEKQSAKLGGAQIAL